MLQFPTGRFLVIDIVLWIAGLTPGILLLRQLKLRRSIYAAAVGALTLWMTFTIDFGLGVFFHLGPRIAWIRGSGYVAIAAMWMTLGMVWLVRQSEGVEPGRRRFLQTAGMVAVGAPLAAARVGYTLGRQEAIVHQSELPIHDLPKDLDGFRIVQLSDMHMSPLVSRRQIAQAVDLANEQRANMALVTGDLISYPGDPLDDCLAELKRLRSDTGTFGCLGNHEIYAQSEDYTTRVGARMGMRFLRRESELFKVGDARLNLVGVDYQRKGTPYLQGVRGLMRPDCVNVLLSHNPDVFNVAAQQGWDAVIAGHTHGGQITLEYVHPALNPAKFITPYVFGLYRKEKSSIFVTSGIGTITLPMRLGVPPEIAVLTLRRAT